MDEQAQQLITRLKEANNVLLTVAANPTVDQLAAVIGLTLLLNKQGKHATAVFSGEVPSTIEFLQPEKTLEKNTDSLRDFIISLDKSKADKLRYKVEDKLVKIFITPYRTSIGDKDLEFSQGDFNVEVVVALGVTNKNDLDKAIVAHGRILHDATVATLSTKATDGLGTIHWVDPKASSLCEMVVNLGDQMGVQSLDSQTATALLTGVVAETERFSNEKTTSSTMAISAKLMAAGANQQLVATKLQEKPKVEVLPPIAEVPVAMAAPGTPVAPVSPPPPADGSLKIDHNEPPSELPEPTAEEEDDDVEKIHIDEHGTLHTEKEIASSQPNLTNQSAPSAATSLVQQSPSSINQVLSGQNPSENSDDSSPEPSKLILEPPTLGGKLTANSEPEQLDPATDPLSPQISRHKLLSHDTGPASATTDPNASDETRGSQDIAPVDALNNDSTQSGAQSPDENKTEVPSDQQDTPDQPAADLESARSAVEAAMGDAASKLEPIAALNAQPVDLGLGHDSEPSVQSEASDDGSESHITPQTDTNLEPHPDASVVSDPGIPPGVLPTTQQQPMSPPPVPPPMMPPTMPPTPQNTNTPPATP